jgi:uncharacterized protein (TIGR00725 family)
VSRPPQIAVIGSGADDAALGRLAEEVGRRIAEAGARTVCGGMSGVMEAASRGAAGAGGEVIGIVPTESPGDANAYVTHPVATGIGHARNLAVVASADAVVAVGGEWGTLSEIAFARRLGRAVIALESWSVRGRDSLSGAPGIVVAESPETAVRAALRAARDTTHE